ncbi:MAG: hypothetical protein EXR79_03915 [Myxococcales bacterium]|nr:hypothetical protein [Myxococcales bacterium]
MTARHRSSFLLATACGALAACSDSITVGSLAYPDAKNAVDGHGTFDGGTPGAASADGAVGGDGAGGAAADGGSLGPVLLFATAKDDGSGQPCEPPVCALLMTQNTQRKLAVRYLRDGQPVADVAVQFAAQDPAASLGQLLLENVMTDDKGLAVTEVKVGLGLGQWSVTAHVPAEPAVPALAFAIQVGSKAKGPLAITLHYVGSKSMAEFGDIKARLTKQDAAGAPVCASLDLDALPPAAWTSPALKWDKPWTISYPNFAATLPQSGAPVAFTVVGVAWPVGMSSLTGKAVAFGCVDSGAQVWWDPKTKTLQGEAVTVDVKDIPPRLKGTYDLTTYLNLVSVLPDGVEIVVAAILDIVKKPVAGIFALACKLSQGSLESLCKNIFQDAKKPNINQLQSPFGGIIVEFLNAILVGLLPANVQAGLQTAGDLAEILTNLEVGGTLQIDQEPDAAGFVPKTMTKQTWTKITYKWSLGKGCKPADANCGKVTFDIDKFQSNAIVGSFDLWRDAAKWEIKIGKHALDVKWGALVSYLIEKQVLPAITFDPKNPTGPVVDSYEKLIKSVIAGKKCLVKDTCCEEFGAQLAGKQSLLKPDFLAAMCEMVITVGVGFLKAQLTGLELKSGDPNSGKGLLLGTDKCPIFDADDDGWIDLVGSPNPLQPADQCQWDMTLQFASKPEQIKATFFATRQQ